MEILNSLVVAEEGPNDGKGDEGTGDVMPKYQTSCIQ
jgi:hypothetical protein